MDQAALRYFLHYYGITLHYNGITLLICGFNNGFVVIVKQVCLRAGQTVGKTQDCYMFSEEDGDALVGRTVAQLKLNADEFDVLPLHFGRETLREIHEYGWSNILPDFSLYPECFRRGVVPHLVACLIYHFREGDLERMFPRRHPIFAQPLFTNASIYTMLKNKVILKSAFCDDSNMSASGVPALITVSREVRELKKAFLESETAHDARIEELEANILDSINNQPQEIINKLLERFKIDGVVPMTLDDIRRCIGEIMSSDTGPLATIAANIARIQHVQGAGNDGTTNVDIHAEALPVDVNYTGIIYHWPGDDRIHKVPVNFKFPSYVLGTMWNLWFFGDSRQQICPYRHISPQHDLTSKGERVRFSKCKLVMNRMIQIAIRDKKITRIGEINSLNGTTLYNHSYPLFIEALYPNSCSRPADLNINTLSNRIYAMKFEVV